MRWSTGASLTLAIVLLAMSGPALAQADASPGPTPSGDPAASPSGRPAELDRTVWLSEPRWRRITLDRGPAAREDHTWTVDADGRYAYLFGGRDGAREFGDTWRYDLRRDTWKQLSPKGRTPAPRFGHSAVWVEGRGLVVFAGQRGTDFFDDLWQFDPERRRWKQLPARGSVPKPRYGSCLVVGPDGRLWISHGFTLSGRFDDTRAYNLKTERWATITPDRRRPGERCLHDCFTAADGALVLYGGQDDGAFALGDLWVLGRERTWDRRQDPAPAPRRLYGVAEAGDVVYVFGGAGNDNRALGDTWSVDRQTLEFRLLQVEGNAPAPRYAGTLIADPARGRLLLFGGMADTARSDVWELVERVAEVPAASEDPGSVTSPAAGPEVSPAAAPSASPAA